MNLSILRTKKVQVLLSVLILVFTAAAMYCPPIYFFKVLNSKAILLMFLLIGSMLTSLILGMRTTMLASIVACAALSYFLKSHSNIHVSPTSVNLVNESGMNRSDNSFLKVAQFNAQELGTDGVATLKTIKNLNADLIFIQELTPLDRKSVV